MIKEERHMMKLLHFLVLSLKTVDGVKNSALPYLNLMVLNDKLDIRALKILKEESPQKYESLVQGKMSELSLNVLKRFMVMKARIKISFMAFTQ